MFSTLPQYLQLPENSEGKRLFHGRGHAYEGLHHVTVDWLSPVVLITIFAPEDDAALLQLTAWLQKEIPACSSIQLQHRYLSHGPVHILWGENIEQVDIEENGLKYRLRLGKARNTGLFLDMRNGRRWVREKSANKRVLNLFAYTCGFSVAAIAGNAQQVVNVDMSSGALSTGRENHRLNNQPLEKIRFEKLEIFRSFGRLKKRGPFDLLICDPPTFQKGSVDIVKDYPKILRRLDEFMAPGSALMLCLNAPELGADFLMGHMSELAPRFTFTEAIRPPAIFKEAQGKGLTTLCFRDIGV